MMPAGYLDDYDEVVSRPLPGETEEHEELSPELAYFLAEVPRRERWRSALDEAVVAAIATISSIGLLSGVMVILAMAYFAAGQVSASFAAIVAAVAIGLVLIVVGGNLANLVIVERIWNSDRRKRYGAMRVLHPREAWQAAGEITSTASDRARAFATIERLDR